MSLHWSRQFPNPKRGIKMSGLTGMSDGSGSPTINVCKWHEGKLYMGGAWSSGVRGDDLTKFDANIYWYIWSWSKNEGYKPIAWQHSATGGPGPVGVVNDFLWLPDGRMVIGGEFNKIGNICGPSFHRIKGLAVFDKFAPKGKEWKPFAKSVQHNGPGSINTLAYDSKSGDLWVGGSFSGFRMDPQHLDKFCFGVQRYSFKEETWKIMPPGIRGGTIAHKIKIDERSSPSTVYIAGKFTHTAGDGKTKINGGSAIFSTGFCAWKEDEGWITFPQKEAKFSEDILQRAADFAYFDSVNVFDFLIDREDIWIVGSFSEGKKSTKKDKIRGIAKWDKDNQEWIDPTGKGGFGRDLYSITKTEDGKIYVAGAFGGLKSGKNYYDGFKNGENAFLGACFDPKTNQWTSLEEGLDGVSMPVCRVMSVKNDVIYFGKFKHVGRDAKKNGFESYYIARWNEYVDFTKKEFPDLLGCSNDTKTIARKKEKKIEGLEHWSRAFCNPPRRIGGKTKQSVITGMDNGVGTPDIKCLKWYGKDLYFAGSWEMNKGERWFIWKYNKKTGWERIAWKKIGKEEVGFTAPPEGFKFHEGKMFVYGSSEKWKGIAVYDPKSKEWSEFTGTYNGKQIKGNGAKGNPAIHDIAWDSKTGDMFLVGSCGEEIRYEKGHKGGTVPSQVLRVDKNQKYHAMGLMLLAQVPSKPILSVNCIYLDETKTPTDIYIGGCFGFKGMDSDHKNAVYNVAKWDYSDSDWSAIGKGDFWRIGMHDLKTFPEGQPGLKAQPVYGFPTFLTDLFGKVRCLTMDKAGNLYAGGAIGILDDNEDITKRKEQYGLVKYDPKKDIWTAATNCGGVSRDVFQMSWIDDTHLLCTGGFLYSEDFRLLNNIGILDVTTGDLKPLAGGLYKPQETHVISCNVVHAIANDGFWFGGFFQYAGVHPKSITDAPIESNFVAHYNPSENLDPNGNLVITTTPECIKGPKGFSSESKEIVLKAENIPNGGKVIWYQLSYGKVKKIGEGQTKKARIRVSKADTSFNFYASVLSVSGVQGGKIPIIVKVN